MPAWAAAPPAAKPALPAPLPVPLAEPAPPPPVAEPAPAPPSRWLPLIGSLALPLVVAIVVFFGESPFLSIMLALTLVAALLLAAAVLPPGIVARAGASPAYFSRYREPLALAAIGILAPVAACTLVILLS